MNGGWTGQPMGDSRRFSPDKSRSTQRNTAKLRILISQFRIFVFSPFHRRKSVTQCKDIKFKATKFKAAGIKPFWLPIKFVNSVVALSFALVVTLPVFGTDVAQPGGTFPNVTKQNINGYEVRFVDVQAGNTFEVAFTVPIGSLHASGRLLGLPHLFEHMMLKGSQAYPGFHSLTELATPHGLEYNAWTSSHRTLYHMRGLEDSAETAVKLLLASLKDLEWNRVTFQKEVGNVINEVAREGTASPLMAMMDISRKQLTSPNHPWAGYLLGSQESLAAISIEDLKRFYYQNYGPQQVTILIYGNFTSGKWNLQTVSRWLSQHLTGFSNPEASKYMNSKNALAEREFPPSVAESSLGKRIHIVDEDLTVLSMDFEIDLNSENYRALKRDALDLLAKYFSDKLPGSLQWKLSQEQKWISAMGSDTLSINNLGTFNVWFELTPAGRDNLDGIQEHLFKTLSQIRSFGPDPEILAHLKALDLVHAHRRSLDVATLSGFYPSLMDSGVDFANLTTMKSGLGPDDIRAAANLINPSRVRLATLGPESLINSAKILARGSDPVYRRAFFIVDHSAMAQLAQEIFTSTTPTPPIPRNPPHLTLPTVHLLPSDMDRDEHTDVLVKNVSPGEVWIFDDTKPIKETLAKVEFRLPLASWRAKEALALSFLLRSFMWTYKMEFDALNAKGVALSVNNFKGELIFTGLGMEKDEKAVAALIWAMERFKDYNFDPNHFDLIFETIRSDILFGYASDFSAFLAVNHLRQRLDPTDTPETAHLEALDSLTAKDVMPLVKSSLVKADRQIAVLGKIPGSALQALSAATWKLIDLELETHDREFSSKRWNTLFPGEIFTPWAFSRPPESFGTLQTYNVGPRVFEDMPGFFLLQKVLSQLVFQLNRSERSLGYIHSFEANVPRSGPLSLFFLGQADSPENLLQTWAGWNEILRKVGERAYPEALIQDAIASLQREFSEKPTRASDWWRRYTTSLSAYGHIVPRERTLAQIKNLSVEHFYTYADRWLVEKPFTRITLGATTCAEIIAKSPPSIPTKEEPKDPISRRLWRELKKLIIADGKP